MREVAQAKTVMVRTKIGGRLTVVRDASGAPLTKIVYDQVWRETRNRLGGMYGPDRDRKLVVGFAAGDMLTMYPKGTRKKISVNIGDVYAWALRIAAARAVLEKARDRKQKLADQRERRRIADADRRMRRDAKALKHAN